MTPGCLLRSTLATFGLIFLPYAVWFLYRDWTHNLVRSLVLIAVSAWFLVLAFRRTEHSFMSTIDDLGGKPGA